MLYKSLQFLLSKWFFGLYLLLGLIYFFISPVIINAPCSYFYFDSLFIALGLMTGGDPYTFKPIIESHFILWILAWFIHITSWLLIPALIGLVITDVADNIKKEQRTLKILNDFVIKLGLSPEEVSELVPLLKGKVGELVNEGRKAQ